MADTEQQEVIVVNGEDDQTMAAEKTEEATGNTENKDVEMEEKKEEEKEIPIEQLARGMVKISPIVINDMKIKEFLILLHKSESFSMEFEKREDKKEGEITLNFAPEKPGYAWNIIRTIAHLKLTNKELKVECPQSFAEVIAIEKEGRKKQTSATPAKSEEKDESNFVKVSNIPTDTTEETLKSLFPDAVKINLEKDGDGNFKGVAVLELSTGEAAKEFLTKNKELKIGENDVTVEIAEKPKDPFEELKKRWERWSGSGEAKKKKKKKKKAKSDDDATKKATPGQRKPAANQALMRAKQARMRALKMRQNRMAMGNRGLMGPGPNMRQGPFMMNQMEMMANMMNMGGGGMMNQMGGMGGRGMMGGGGGGSMMRSRGDAMMGGGGMMMRGEGMMGGDGMMGGGGMMGSPVNRGMRQRQSSMGQDFDDFGPDRAFEERKMRELKEQQFQHLQQMKQQRGMRGQGGSSMMGNRGNFGFQEDNMGMGMGNRFRRNSAQGFDDDTFYQSGYGNRGGFDDEDDDFMYGFQNVPGKRKTLWDDDNQGAQGGQWGGGFKRQRGGGGGSGGGRGGGGGRSGGRGGGGGGRGGNAGGGGRGGKKKGQQQKQQGGSWKSSEDMWSDFMSNQSQSGGGYPY